MESLKLCVFILLVILVFQASNAVAAENVADLEVKLQKIMSQRRQSKPHGDISDAELKTVNPHLLLSLLEPYEKDPVWSVRRIAYFYEIKVAHLHPTAEVRQEVTKRLVEASITGSMKQAGTWLMNFTAKDFGDQSKSLIRQALTRANKGKVGGDPSIWLCGVANVQDQLPRLKELLIDELAYRSDPNMRHLPKWYYTSGWAARLARAHMGVEADIARCIQLVDSILRPKGYFEDRVSVPETRLLENISYIAQPDSVKYLQGYLESDKKLMGPHGEPWEPVASYVLDLLIRRLKDFPIERKRGRFYSRDEIERARKWMVQQKELKIIR
jgi:hypothetical protein